MSCGVGRRCSSDPVLLWLWCRWAATALIGLLAWEPPYASGAALKRHKRKKERKNERERERERERKEGRKEERREGGREGRKEGKDKKKKEKESS